MRRPAILLLALLLALAAAAPARPAGSAAAAADPGPVGWASYRELDRLPILTQGSRTHQVASTDPTGNNDDGYSGKYSCLHHVPEGCLLAHHRGPGELDQVWSAGWAPVFNPVFPVGPGDVSRVGKLKIELDGRVVVDAPMQDIVDGKAGGVFVRPLIADATQTSGGFSLSVPMPFRRELRITTQDNPHYFHVVYRTFRSTQGIRTFASRRAPADVVRTLRAAGTRDPKPSMGPTALSRRSFVLPVGRTKELARLDGPAAITRLRLRFRRYGGAARNVTAQRSAIDAWRNVRLRISFDGARTVDAPAGEFFGSGVGPAKVRALLFAMDGGPHGWATSWWPMPFARSARIELVNNSRTAIAAGDLTLSSARSARWRVALGPGGDAGLFHADSRRGPTVRGQDWTFLDVRGAGKFVGVTHTMEGGDPPYHLEGNETGRVDGARSPQLRGTGTEDFYLGGWYFRDSAFTQPFSGYPAGRARGPGCAAGTCKAAYRLLVVDAVPFSRSLRFTIEHGPRGRFDAVYGSTAYSYRRP